MIFGITLKMLHNLKSQPDDKKVSKRVIRLLNKKSNKKFKTKQIQDLSFSDFVDCESFLRDENFKDFCSIFVVKNFFDTVYFHNLPLIIEEYSKQKAELIEQNDFIFDPPQYGEQSKETLGTEVQKEFVERFGNYVILMDVVMKWDKSGYKEIEKWKVKEFFFWANYLKGQQLIENVK